MPLPDEGIRTAALPAASSPDAIDLVGVQAGVTRKLASTLLATQAELDTVNAAAAHLAGAETFTGAKWFTASETPFGTGAAGGAGAFVRIGDFGDAAKVELIAAGAGANIDFAARTKGTGVHRLKNGAGADLATLDSLGNLRAIGPDNKFGAGALGGAGTWVFVGSAGDPNNAYVRGEGSGADVGLILRSKGASAIRFQDGSGNIKGYFDVGGNPADSSALFIEINIGGTNFLKRLLVGAADSGGAGFRTVRIPN